MLLPKNIISNGQISREARQFNDKIMKQINEIQTQIQEIPDGERIHLPKEELENLLFIDISYSRDVPIIDIDGNQIEIVRFLYHRFVDMVDLSRIDLSDVDFSGVCWLSPFQDFLHTGKVHSLQKLKQNGVIFGGMSHDANWNFYGAKNYQMDLSNTNAKIDFQDSFFPHFETEMRSIYADHVLKGYNFEGTDLSNSNIASSFIEIKNCNLDNTGELNFEDKSLGEREVYDDCSFIGTTVNGYTITNKNENHEAIQSMNYYDERKFRI